MSRFYNLTIVCFIFSLYPSMAQGEVDLDSLDLENNDILLADSLWLVDSNFENSLIIPSYEELLKTYYEAVVTVDERLNFNPYRYKPKHSELVNPFTFDNVVFPEDSSKGKITLSPEEPKRFEDNPVVILTESRARIAKDKPELMTATWDMLPDPPKTEKADIIHNVNLDLSNIDTRRRRINRPEKIEKEKYIYKPWHLKIVSMLSANQTAFFNWAKGGTNSLSLSGRIVADFDYISFNEDTHWDNNIESRLGYIQQEDKPFVKNLDLFRANTEFAHNAFNKWFYALNAEFTSQFFDGYNIKSDNYDDPISGFLAPAYLKINMGLDYKYKTKKNKKLFSLQASPISYKLTYVKDTARFNQEKFGIEAGQKRRQEIGGSIQLQSEYQLKDKLITRSRLLLFSNYMEKPENVDLNWNSTVTYRFSRIFAVTLTVDMMYDDDVDILLDEDDDGNKTYGQRLQVKEYIGFGLTYRLM